MAKNRRKLQSKRPVYVWTDGNDPEESPDHNIVNSLQPMITFSNVFGFFPLFLHKNSNQEESKTWKKNLKIAYLIFVIFTIHLLALTNFAEYFSPDQGPKCVDISCYLRQFTGLCFNLCCITSSFYFATMGLRKFEKIIVEWNRIGHRFQTCFVTSISHFFLPRKFCFRFVLIYYGMVIFEHVMQDLWLIHSYVQSYRENKVKTNFFYSLFNDSYPLTYALLHYLPWSEIWLYIGGKYKVIAWNYADFVIISIGLCINFSLSAFAKQLSSIKSKEQWKFSRKIHRELCELVDSLDDFLSPVILLTLGVTTYFICNQIYYQFQFTSEVSLLRVLYGSMSIVLLSLRAGGTILVSAQIQEHRQIVLNALKNCPSCFYDVEVERFWDQAVDYSVAFSGAKLFYINRRFFLTIVSLIITYELVFLGLI